MTKARAANPPPAPWSPQRLREQLGFSTLEWARILGVSVRTVARWEDGSCEPSGLAAEVFRGLTNALDGGARAHDIHQHLALGLGHFIALAAE